MGKIRKMMWVLLFLMAGPHGLQASFTTEELDDFEQLTGWMMYASCVKKASLPQGKLEELFNATKDARLKESQDPCEALKELHLLFSKAAPLTRTFGRDIHALRESARRLDPETFHHAAVGLLTPDSRQAIRTLKEHYAHGVLVACPQTEVPLQCHILMTRFFEDVCRIEGYWDARRVLEGKMIAVVEMVEQFQQFTPGMRVGRVEMEDIRD